MSHESNVIDLASYRKHRADKASEDVFEAFGRDFAPLETPSLEIPSAAQGGYGKAVRLPAPSRVSFAAESRMKMLRVAPTPASEISDCAITTSVLTFASASGSFLLGADMLNEIGAVLFGATCLVTAASIGRLINALRKYIKTR